MGKPITLIDFIRMSHKYYRMEEKTDKHERKVGGDNKRWRAKLDILNARIIKRFNYDYNKSLKKWEQTGDKIRIEFLVRSDPQSYDKIDTIKTHRYPVTVIIDNLDKGIYSTFQWRTGSLKKPVFHKVKGDQIKVANKNIKNQVQLQFFFDLEFVLKQYGLLYGRCWAKRPPLKTNPKRRVYADKHFWMICTSFLVRMLNVNGGAVKGLIIANKKK